MGVGVEGSVYAYALWMCTYIYVCMYTYHVPWVEWCGGSSDSDEISSGGANNASEAPSCSILPCLMKLTKGRAACRLWWCVKVQGNQGGQFDLLDLGHAAAHMLWAMGWRSLGNSNPGCRPRAKAPHAANPRPRSPRIGRALCCCSALAGTNRFMRHACMCDCRARAPRLSISRAARADEPSERLASSSHQQRPPPCCCINLSMHESMQAGRQERAPRGHRVAQNVLMFLCSDLVAFDRLTDAHA